MMAAATSRAPPAAPALRRRARRPAPARPLRLPRRLRRLPQPRRALLPRRLRPTRSKFASRVTLRTMGLTSGSGPFLRGLPPGS
ncbi:hypothetical protein FS320_02865 [Microvirga tunisiensis]|uniref:Uncharacterized protein n=1 Tax=Microvirga tunisiensis TaxID=2108360 RepID=A0A5N7MB94_9HYPH|nr:hypothetical protein [Microvirga tunisiensis]MPR24192.1 hypothetical protein [Microvirga tunisiensis]